MNAMMAMLMALMPIMLMAARLMGVMIMLTIMVPTGMTMTRQ